MPLGIDSTDRLCICGQTGTGKTYFMRWLCSLADPNLYIMDVLNQYPMYGDVGDVLQGGKRWVANPLKNEVANPLVLESIAKKFHHIGDKTLIIEESERFIPQVRPLLPWTSSLFDMGRNWGVGIWIVTRRIQNINKAFFDLAQHVLFFRCGFKSREYISDMIGNEYMYPSAKQKTKYVITTLPDYHCLHFNLEDESAQVVTLTIRGQSSRIQEVGKKSEVDRKSVEKLRDAAAEGAKEKEKEKNNGMV